MNTYHQTLFASLVLISVAAGDLRAEDGTPQALYQASSESKFKVFDSTLYKNKPDIAHYGIRAINIIYGGGFWDKGEDKAELPRESRVRRLAREAKSLGDIAIIDIEHWPTRGESGPVAESLAKYRAVLGWFHSEVPTLRVGYYGVPPIRDYWRAIKWPSSAEYAAWQAENDRLAPLAKDVDALFPSIYTFYPDKKGWVKYALAQISEARRYSGGKPVFAFLWPQYHDSNRLLGGRFIPTDYWRLQLETVRQHADGIVIWGGWDLDKNRPMTWDNTAPWWRATKQFLRDIGKF